MTFDSHEAATAYRQAGFTDAQVEALVAVDRTTTALPDITTLASKADLQGKVKMLQADIKAVRSDLQADIKAVRSELLAAIETAKYQMLTGVIVAMASLTAIALAVGKLVH